MGIADIEAAVAVAVGDGDWEGEGVCRGDADVDGMGEEVRSVAVAVVCRSLVVLRCRWWKVEVEVEVVERWW